MNHKQLLSLYGLKWNPFSMEYPDEALISSGKIEHFCKRVEVLASDGGFALISGESGLGKSALLRLLYKHLQQLPDVIVAELTRPQSSVSDFYRELGELFNLNLNISNRWRGFSELREKWQEHMKTTLYRPVLLIDEAQEMLPQSLSELRLLSSMHFDSKIMLTIVFCGDLRFLDKLRLRSLIPLGTRIRVRLNLEAYTYNDLIKLLKSSLEKAGNSQLMTEGLIQTLAEHSCGNPRIMMTMANELLLEAASKELNQLNEGLYLEFYQISHGKQK